LAGFQVSINGRFWVSTEAIIPGLSNTLVAQLGKLPPRSLNTRQMGASSAGPSTSPGADAPVRNQQVAGSNPAVGSIRFTFKIS